jgi:L-fuculose-phosphate aldolase
MTDPFAPWADPLASLVAQLAEVGRDAVGRGLVLASGGNISARVPGEDAFVVTAAATWLDRLVPEDFSVVGFDGTVLGGHPKPSSEWKLHARTYEARPDVNSVVHLHPLTAVVLDACGIAVRLITLDHAYYLGKVNRVPFNHNGSDELADTSAEASLDSNAIILAHHGCSTLGDTVAMAYRRALSLEEAAKATMMAIQVGNTDAVFPPDAFRALHHG